MPLNPQIAHLLGLIARAPQPPLRTLTPVAARRAYERSASILDVAPAPLERVEALRIATRDGTEIDAQLYSSRAAAAAQPQPVLLFFHGGGFTVGSIKTHDALVRIFARDADCAVLSVDYRLAPEYRFPTAHNDAIDAMHWLFKNADALGLDTTRIAVGGDSAGGTLAAVCAIEARAASLPLVLQMLIYPGASARQNSLSHQRYANGYLLDEATVQWFFAQYLLDDAQRDDWRFAPLDGVVGRPRFDGLAPAWIAAAEYDPLYDEDVAYAQKLRAAGNRVTLMRYEGMIHEFFKLGRLVPDVTQAHADAVAALKGAFNAIGGKQAVGI